MSAAAPQLPQGLAPAVAQSQASTAVPATRWIISQREDLVWFIGPALVSAAALALMQAGFPFGPLFFLWMFVIDGPHVWATMSRTYFDTEARSRLGWLLWIFVPFVGIGLAAVSAGLASWYFLAAVCWQHFHIVKQHYGFLMLWKAKNGERNRVDFYADRIYLLASLLLPLARFVISTRPLIAALPGMALLRDAAWPLMATLTAAWLLRQVWAWRAGAAPCWPKMLLMASVVPLQWAAFAYAATLGAEGVARAGLTLGIFHGLQYHRLLWFHNRNRYSPEVSARHGFAVRLASGLVPYLAVAMGFQALTYIPVLLASRPEYALVIPWAASFTHYVLDSKIWHVRTDPALAAALGMRKAA